MLDLAYIAGTLVFFALMLGYVQLCETLGARQPGDVAGEDAAP